MRRSGRGEKAIRNLQEAKKLENKPPIVHGDEVLNRSQAKRLRNDAQEEMKPPCELVERAGEAMRVDFEETNLERDFVLLNTLRHANMISVDASEARLNQAYNAGVLEAAVDASESVQARNSLEKMLCHQMAAAHRLTMKLAARAMNDRLAPVESARLTNSAARMMDVYQSGLTTLLKFRTGGKQTVVVQHVQVSNGGQAVVAGSVKGGDPAGEGSEK